MIIRVTSSNYTHSGWNRLLRLESRSCLFKLLRAGLLSCARPGSCQYDGSLCVCVYGGSPACMESPSTEGPTTICAVTRAPTTTGHDFRSSAEGTCDTAGGTCGFAVRLSERIIAAMSSSHSSASSLSNCVLEPRVVDGRAELQAARVVQEFAKG